MKIRISYVVDVDDAFRRAINHYYGRPGLASRQAVKNWFQAYGDSASDDILYDLQQQDRLKAALGAYGS
jgi:hypothetical protein